jgi:hypothetical protein
LTVVSSTPLVHTIQQAIGLMNSEYRTLGNRIQLGVGDNRGNLNNDISFRLKPSHFQIDPDKILFSTHGASPRRHKLLALIIGRQPRPNNYRRDKLAIVHHIFGDLLGKLVANYRHSHNNSGLNLN